jgi:VRR-NUC domain
MTRAAPSEHEIQTALLDALRYAARPDSYHFSIPNAGRRSFRIAAQMKAEGLKAGIADLCFMLPDGRAAWLEMKKRGGSLSVAQRGFGAICTRLGHPWAVAYSVEEAFEILADWNVLKPKG